MADAKKDARENALPAVSPTVAIFLGIGAARTLADRGESRPLRAFLKADAMRLKGASEIAIYEATNKIVEGTPYAGVSYDAANNPRFEVSDHDAKLAPSGLNATGRGTMGDLLRHPELYKALPSTAVLEVKKGGIAGSAGYDGRTVYLNDSHFAPKMLAGRPLARQTVRGSVLHELQHHGQDEDRRPAGGSPKDFESRFPGEENAGVRKALYRSIGGENEAEVTRHRMGMTPDERRAVHPDQTLADNHMLPRDRQIVMDSHGRIVEMADDLKDFGEKIGGARKDRAVKTGPKPKRDAPVDDRPGWAKRFVAAETIDRATKLGSGQWALLDTRKKGSFGGHPSATRQTFASKAEAERAIPLLAVSQKHRVREQYAIGADGKTDKTKTEYEIWRQVGDKKQVKAVNQAFSTREAAMAHMVQNAETLLGTARGYGEEILARPEKVVRSGPAWRSGDIAPEKFMADFRARGVEFGHWQGDRQQVTNMAYDAMRDLADITGIAPESVTLKERLGIAFGARGNGGKQGAAAHYERDFVAINLTKEKGAGHLAHEWMHALDHYLGTVDDPNLAETTINEHGEKVLKTTGRESDYASHRVASRSATGQLPDPVREAYRNLIETMTTKPTEVTVEASRYEKQVASAAENLKSEIDAVRRNLATEVPYGKRNTAPATSEQLARFDEIAAKILAGEGGETKRVLNEGRNGGIAFSARNTNPAVDALSAIMKEVRGRAGWDSKNEQGPMDRLARAMRGVEQARSLVEQAKASPTRTVMSATEFAREAAKLDQSRTSPYWNTRHEMAARAFSAYIDDKLASANRQSNYLAFGSDNTFYKVFQDVKPFPEGAERAAINSKFDALFAAMKSSQVVQPAPTVSTGAGMAAATDIHEAMKGTRAPAKPEVPGNGPAGWSDEARAASAEARAADAKPGPAVKAARANDVNALAKALNTNATRAADVLKAYKKGRIDDAHLEKVTPKTRVVGMAANAADPLAAAKAAMDAATEKAKAGDFKRSVTLGDGRKVSLGQYTAAWKLAKALPPDTRVQGSPASTFRNAPNTAGDAVTEFREGMQDRINKHDPAFGKGRKWDSSWQRDARRLQDTLARKSEVPKGEAHPVDLRAKVAHRLQPGTQIPGKGGDRNKATQAARNPGYIAGVGVPQQPGMTFKAPPTPTVADLPAGAFKGSQQDFSSLSPGMRREIQRTAEKMAAKKATPQVAPLPGMAPMGAKIGFQNEATLNAALKAQGKAESGKANRDLWKVAGERGIPTAVKSLDSMSTADVVATAKRFVPGFKAGKTVTREQASQALASEMKTSFRENLQLASDGGHAKPVAKQTVASLKAEAKAAGIKGASKMTKASLMEALGKNVNRIGMVGMVAAPVAAAMVAYDATRSSANAAGVDRKTATFKAATAAAVAGGVTAGIGYGIGKGIGLTFRAAAAIAPKVAPFLGPAGIALGVGMMGYGAYHGYQKGGIKGAALGAIGADGLLDLGKTPSAPPANPEGTPRGIDAAKASEFEARNTAYNAMQETARNVVQVTSFARERHTEAGTVVKETVNAYTRARPNQ